MTQSVKTYDELVELLYLLDKAIERKYPESDLKVKLDVVGGFALMYHRLRIANGSSRDIDAANEISAWLWKTAYDIDGSNWLNDHASEVLVKLMPEVRDNMEFVKDCRYVFPYDHIELHIASIETLFGMKLNALKIQMDQGFTLGSIERLQDVTDSVEILAALGIRDRSDFIKNFPKLGSFVSFASDDIFSHFGLFGGSRG